MNEIRTVTLELLRQGPAHNQLLSPLTPYLALCGNHSAVTVQMPFEHNQLLMRLNALRYKDSPETWRLQLADTSRMLAGVLSQVPGLIAELSDGSGNAPPLTHLRLILSPSELALVPFEMANAPDGFPGAGQPLVLQPQSPLCITREVQRVGGRKFQWPTKPKILFVAASPAGVATVPIDAHMLALRQAIDPWLEKDESERADMESLDKYLVVLPQATVESIHAACRGQDFTHVHILAHGARLPGREERYGIVLHKAGAPDESDIVEAERLAKVFRTYSDKGDNSLLCPAVVTIAACEGADQGSVVGAGASIAHTLHEAGVPLVVASQFPLSFAASVLLAEVLYRGLLWGSDPRTLLNDLRWQLKAKLPDTHDWASLVAYTRLPPDFENQLWKSRVVQSWFYFDVAVSYLSKLTGLDDGNDATQRNLVRASTMIAKAMGRFQLLLNEGPAGRSRERAEVYGLLGMTLKWDAMVRFMYQPNDEARPGNNQDKHDEITDLLRQAERDYYLAFRTYAGEIYPLVQELAIAAAAGGSTGVEAKAWSEKWEMARMLGENVVDHQPSVNENIENVLEARSDLLELYLLGQLRGSESERAERMNRALEHARRLADCRERNLDLLDATISELKFYTDFYNKYNPTFAALEAPARRMIDVLRG